MASSGVSANLDEKALLAAKQDILLQYTYPRLDIEVSKKLNHLLKSPFVVHPGTGRICVPIPISTRKDGKQDWSALDDFNPLTVPTVIEILNEIDAWDSRELANQAQVMDEQDSSQNAVHDSNGQRQDKVPDFAKTALKPFVEYFKSFVADLIKAESRSLKRDRDEDGNGEAEMRPESMDF